MSDIHLPPEHIAPVYRWYKKAQIDYTEQYIRMYIAYNSWYREVTNTTNDREALAQLKKRIVIWDDYARGKTMSSLKVYMERLVDLTQAEPLGKTLYWSGSIESRTDWRSLIEYWYYIRCLLVHGVFVKPKYVWLAYETLDIFMSEIIDRMQKILNEAVIDTGVLSEQAGTTLGPSAAAIKRKIFEKYVSSPNIWNVDMNRVHSN